MEQNATGGGNTPGQDVGGSSPAQSTTSSEPKYSRENIASFIKKGREGKATPTQSPTQAQAPDSDVNSPAAEASAEAQPTEKTEKKADSVPMEAFQKRIGKLTAKVKEAEGQVQSRDLELKQMKAAFQMLTEEYQRAKELLASNNLADERDEKINFFTLQEKARKANEEIMREHQAAIARAQEEAQVNAEAQSVMMEIEEATAQFALAHPKDVVRYMQVNPDVPAVEIAKYLHEKAMERAGIKPQQPKPPAPETARGPGVGNSHRFEYSQQGILDFLASKNLRKE